MCLIELVTTEMNEGIARLSLFVIDPFLFCTCVNPFVSINFILIGSLCRPTLLGKLGGERREGDRQDSKASREEYTNKGSTFKVCEATF